MDESKDLGRITRREAAELLGVSGQTVANLAKAGALSSTVNGKRTYYSRAEVYDLIPKTDSLRNLERAIAETEDELARHFEELVTAKELSAARREFIESIADDATFYRYRELVEATYRAVENTAMLVGKLTTREIEALRSVISLRPLGEIALDYDITKERVRQIFERALRRMAHFAYGVGENFRNLQAQLDKERKRANDLKSKNEQLHATLKAYEDSAKNFTQSPIAQARRERILASRIDDQELSARLRNCCRRAHIVTVADLASKSRGDLMKIRNFGTRSLMEADSFLESNGLWYDMKSNKE